MYQILKIDTFIVYVGNFSPWFYLYIYIYLNIYIHIYEHFNILKLIIMYKDNTDINNNLQKYIIMRCLKYYLYL